MQNMFLKIDGPPVDGECEDRDHKGWIEILSYSHGVAMPTGHSQSSAGARTTGRCDHQDFTISKYMDKATPVLNLACSAGQHYKTVTVELFRATTDGGSPVKYMEYIMTEVILSSISTGASSSDIPMETISFNYATIKWTYTPQKKGAPAGKDSNIPTGWSLVTNKQL